MFLPLSLLSYASILGIISTVFVVIVLLVDGISKTEAPGSFRSPEETSLGFENLNYLASAFGLFMAGVRLELHREFNLFTSPTVVHRPCSLPFVGTGYG
jgi:hypothetical protein